MILVIAWSAVLVYASGDPNVFFTIHDYISYAETHNPELKSSYYRWQATIEEIPQAATLSDPEIKYSYLTRQSNMQMSQTLSVMQMFPWFGTLDAKTEEAAKRADAAHQKYQSARLALLNEIKVGFYEFAYLARAIDIATENLELLRHFEEVARTKYAASQADQPDIIRAQVELARMEYVLRDLEQMRKPAVSKLIKALNLPKDANLPWPHLDNFDPVEINYDYIVGLLRQKNPELTALSNEMQAAKSRIELAEKNRYPDIGLGLEWTRFERSGQMNGRDSVALMFQLNLPLWQDSYGAGKRQALADAASIEQQRIDAENTLLSKAAQAFYEYNDSVIKIKLYRDALIPKGKELLKASETAYKAGTADFLSLIESQQLVLDYYLSYHRALTDNRQKLAELEMLVGTELN